MYKVVLVHKEDHDVIGEIGSYNEIDEATSEAQNYNRKGDRHIGHAIVQATIDGSPIRRTNGLRLGQTDKHSVRYSTRTPLNKPSSRIVPEYNRYIPEEVEEESSEEETRVYQRPSWHDRRNPQPQSNKVFAFLIDPISKKGIVLEENQFLQNFLIAHPTYEVQSKGQIHEMILQRNRYLQNRRR